MCDCHTESDKAEPSDAESRSGILSNTRRGALKLAGAAGATLAGVPGLSVSAPSTSSRGQYDDVSYNGFSEPNGSDSSMDLVVVDVSADYDGKGREAFEGLDYGLRELEEEADWFTGHRVYLVETDEEYEGDGSTSEFESILDDLGWTAPKHYLFVFDGSTTGGSFHANGSGEIWGSDTRQITGISIESTEINVTPPTEVRGLHQVLHSYIEEEEAKNLTGFNDGYHAVHALGGAVDMDIPRRTIMADAYGNKHDSGGACADLVDAQRPERKEHIAFSDCTLTALDLSR